MEKAKAKVLEYLAAGHEILSNRTRSISDGINVLAEIEIAKMLQLEELKDPKYSILDEMEKGIKDALAFGHSDTKTMEIKREL